MQEAGPLTRPQSSSLHHSKANGSTHTSLESRPSTGEPPPKKSNWEVIEHYSKSGLVGASSPKSPPEESSEEEEDVESILLDGPRPWNFKRLLGRMFLSHQFKNIHVEVLYQRYFLRMNQASLTSLLALLMVVVLVLVILLVSLEQPLPVPTIVTLSAFAVLYLFMEVLLVKSLIRNEVCLVFISYFILLSFLGLELLLILSSEVKEASNGVWITLFFTYATYTFLPMRLLEAMAGGIILSVVQLLTAGFTSNYDDYLWKQVSKR